ncbi:hypothetical protein [Nocardioides jishulii]|uniref:Uncharacterized protein n=1 Tax=Nocardioides jishulii TaxID=2575440 RepID=A0A4U2YU40_9ACTN|nr:hypothetical protein [Nocardioides jishulii]QCX28682.1 hypothetical protein FCL41_14930 [Nocardioides jishulii]TKI64425.1 hypothetical protein FC770_04645 [Nocardioides jishulii]
MDDAAGAQGRPADWQLSPAAGTSSRAVGRGRGVFARAMGKARDEKEFREFQSRLAHGGGDLPELRTVTVDVAKDALQAVRERADGWRTGAASWLALGVGVMTLKGKDDGIGAFAGSDQVLLLVVLGLSVVLGLASLWFFLQAAHGPYWLDSTVQQLSGAYDAERYCRRAFGAAQDLRRGQVTWLLSFLFYCVTVVLLWVL